MWIIYSKDGNKPLWKSTDRETLSRLMAELNKTLGSKFYLKQYKEKK